MFYPSSSSSSNSLFLFSAVSSQEAAAPKLCLQISSCLLDFHKKRGQMASSESHSSGICNLLPATRERRFKSIKTQEIFSLIFLRAQADVLLTKNGSNYSSRWKLRPFPRGHALHRPLPVLFRWPASPPLHKHVCLTVRQNIPTTGVTLNNLPRRSVKRCSWSLTDMQNSRPVWGKTDWKHDAAAFK